MTLEVVEPGLLTTVQDAGRPDWTHVGVPVGGACDRWSLAVANLLAGNAPGAAALEMTVAGGALRVTAPIRIGLAGADLGGHVRETGQSLRPGRADRLATGVTIDFPGMADVRAGARAYLAVQGGIDVPEVLGSRSTALAAGFGGLEGRALRSGDVVRATDHASAAGGGDTWPESIGPLAGTTGDPDGADGAIRIIAGPWAGTADLVGRSWRVASGSDRIGLRLDGERIGLDASVGLPSFGVVPGCIQVPPDGAPIALLADAQTTGGYPVVAVTIAADLPRLAQLRPGADVRFVAVTIEAATEALRGQLADLERGTAALRESAAWDAAWQGAGG